MLFEKLSLKNKFTLGFSLTEVVITIAIVSILAGLAVPGIMTSANNSKRLSVTKQTISLIGDAFNDKLESNAIDLTRGFDQFVDVTGGGGLQYTRRLTSSGGMRTIDTPPNAVLLCQLGGPCNFTPGQNWIEAVTLKNGGILVYNRFYIFDSGINSAIPVLFDPDGEAHGDTNTVELWLYSDGRIRTAKTMVASTTTQENNGTPPFTRNPSTIADPAWLVL